MSDLALDPDTGDLVVENGDLKMVDGVEAVIQHIRTRLKFFANDWFLDLEAGLPYFQEILVKNPAAARIEGLFQNEILQTPGVLELTSFAMDFDPSARTLSITFSGVADGGVIDLTQIQVP